MKRMDGLINEKKEASMEVVINLDDEEKEEILKLIKEPLSMIILEHLKSSKISKELVKEFFKDLLNVEYIEDYIDWERIGKEVTKVITERMKT